MPSDKSDAVVGQRLLQWLARRGIDDQRTGQREIANRKGGGGIELLR